MNKVLGLALSVLLLAAAPARADVVPDLYSAEVPVADQGQGALASAFFGAVGTAGQRCTSTRRVFMQKGVAEKITDAEPGKARVPRRSPVAPAPRAPESSVKPSTACFVAA